MSSGDFATGVGVMEDIAAAIGGRVNETTCDDLESFLDGVAAKGLALT